MDKQQLTRQLHRLAEEEIPDTMNLWPRIQGQLKRKSKPRSFSLAYALSAFVMIMLVGIGGFVAYRSASITAYDPVPPNHVTPLAMSQTIGGVTMSLDWAYADAHIVTLQYTVVYNPQEVTLPDFSVVNLRTADGLLLPQDFNGGGGGGGGYETEMRFTNQVSFDTSVITGNPETLELVLLVQYTENFESYEIQFQPTVPPYPTGLNEPKGDIFTATPIPFDMGTPVVDSSSLTERSNSSTATAIWQATEAPNNLSDPFSLTATSIIATATAMAQPTGMPTVPPPNALIEPSLIPPMQFTPTPIPVPNIFAFSFTVPFYPAKTGRVTATNYGVNTITATVQNLSISPAMTKFELCYSLPNGDALWTPKISLDTGFAANPTLNSSMSILGVDGQMLYPAMTTESTVFGNMACLPMFSYAPFSPEGGTIDIQLEYLYRHAEATDPATWAADEAFFRERGFDLSYAFVPIAAGAEQEFYNESRPSNVFTYPLPEIGALLITMRDYPDALEEWQAHQYIFDHILRERVEGNWNFHVVVD